SRAAGTFCLSHKDEQSTAALRSHPLQPLHPFLHPRYNYPSARPWEAGKVEGLRISGTCRPCALDSISSRPRLCSCRRSCPSLWSTGSLWCPDVSFHYLQ
ncbi:hypothetical protein E3U43_003730, partial [Larimichthys crocea]